MSNKLDFHPPYDYMFTSVDLVKDDSPIIKIGQENTIAIEQTVLSTGPNCQFVEIGDIIGINMRNFLKGIQKTDAADRNNIQQTMEVHLPIFEIDGEDYMRLTERDILYIKKQKRHEG